MSGSLIRMLDGLSSTGSVSVNTSGGAFHANGNMHFGPISGVPPLGDVTFDGLVLIDGDLESRVGVNGCHDPADTLDICICGDNNGSVTVRQTGCDPLISSPIWECPSGTCP